MNPKEFRTVFEFLSLRGLRMPHGLFPGSFPGGVLDLSVRERYEEYRWNPGHLSEVREADVNASPKPTWEYLERILPVALLISERDSVLRRTRVEVGRRIMVDVFGVHSVVDETWARLSGRNTPDRLLERDRLLTRYEHLKFEVLDLSLEQVRAFDPSIESNWTV